LENFADRSNGKKILGLGIFDPRVPLSHTSDETILQDHLIQQGEGLIRLEKERGNDVRKDDTLLKRDER
jgi:hypothetical protein